MNGSHDRVAETEGPVDDLVSAAGKPDWPPWATYVSPPTMVIGAGGTVVCEEMGTSIARAFDLPWIEAGNC
ncbi:MAG: hypothetical protein R3C05_01325 [Pirellulaceae bacterium]